MESSKLHLTCTVSNIKSLIPITLEMESGQNVSCLNFIIYFFFLKIYLFNYYLPIKT
ncbi:hypothetical protein HanIR_Chr04g0205361 [Helianthus annuus]|nr:hypothetical protein HanIR_Chr04g0205361 [Helianthus annuus]